MNDVEKTWHQNFKTIFSWLGLGIIFLVFVSGQFKVTLSESIASDDQIIPTCHIQQKETFKTFVFPNIVMRADSPTHSHAGPFEFELDSGTYDIAIHVFDQHSTGVDMIEEKRESLVFRLTGNTDTVYDLAPSSDLSGTADNMIEVIERSAQIKSSVSNIHVLHNGYPNLLPQDLYPICITFIQSN